MRSLVLKLGTYEPSIPNSFFHCTILAINQLELEIN